MIIRILKFLVRIFLALVRRWEIEGTENIPASGSVVLIANHTSYWIRLLYIAPSSAGFTSWPRPSFSKFQWWAT